MAFRITPLVLFERSQYSVGSAYRRFGLLWAAERTRTIYSRWPNTPEMKDGELDSVDKAILYDRAM